MARDLQQVPRFEGEGKWQECVAERCFLSDSGTCQAPCYRLSLGRRTGTGGKKGEVTDMGSLAQCKIDLTVGPLQRSLDRRNECSKWCRRREGEGGVPEMTFLYRLPQSTASIGPEMKKGWCGNRERNRVELEGRWAESLGACRSGRGNSLFVHLTRLRMS